MTQFPDLFAALAAPFEKHEVRSRSQAGRQFQYITARVAQNRLDSVVGPENWSNRLTMLSDNSFLCEITITLPDGRQVTKADVGGMAGMPDAGDDDKSGASDAFKRAAVQWGIGRYLYRDGVPFFAGQGEEVASPPAPAPEPRRPASREPAPARPAPNDKAAGNGQAKNGAPRSGRALFGWVKDMEQKHEVGLVKYLTGWAKLQDFPGRMVDWDAGQVEQAYGEAIRKLNARAAGRSEAYEDALAN